MWYDPSGLTPTTHPNKFAPGMGHRLGVGGRGREGGGGVCVVWCVCGGDGLRFYVGGHDLGMDGGWGFGPHIYFS